MARNEDKTANRREDDLTSRAQSIMQENASEHNNQQTRSKDRYDPVATVPSESGNASYDSCRDEQCSKQGVQPLMDIERC